MFRLLLLLVGLTLLGCAGREAASKYTQVEIARPYTTPNGIDAWETQITTGIFQNAQGTNVVPWANPFIWHHPLSDNFTLEFFPLPLGLKYQVKNNKDGFIGVAVYGGFSISSDDGFRLKPAFAWSRRDLLSSTWAVQSDLNFNPIFSFDNRPFTWSATFWIGPLWQITPTLALEPRIALGLHQDTITDSELIDRESDIRPPHDARFSVPLGLKAFWNFDPLWNLDGTYSYYRIGEASTFSAHLFLIQLIHYW